VSAPTSTTPHDEAPARPGLAAGAIVFAVLAALLSVYALGVSLATRNGTGAASVAAAPGGLPAGKAVTVDLTEFAIAPAAVSLSAADTVTVTNSGQAAHNLKVKDTDIGTADIQPGGQATLDVSSLAPGTYDVWCDIPGHESAGMVGTVTVGAAGTASDGMDGHDMSGAGAAGFQAMYDTMQASVAAFPAETEGTGNLPMEPTILDDGTKQFVLVLDELRWEVEPGKVVDAVAYNGQIPGPTIRVDVGDRVRIVVENRLDDEITTLHPHGVRGHTFEADGVGFVSQEPILPGETWSAEFVTNEASVGMYHGHDMGLHQVPNGAVGAFFVGDMPLPDGVTVSQEHVMMLNDAGNIGFSLNGKSFPATTPYVLKQGERMLVHYMNEGIGNHPMHLHNNRQLVIAKDGFPLASPYYVDTLDVAPGERYTVVVEAELPGVWVWHCHILPHVEKSDGAMFGMLTALIVEAA
jgi:manganese oxidase